MTVIGLCGGSGSGKGTAARFFDGYGIPSIDADAVYRDITTPGSELLEKLVSIFGEGIIDENGGLDRAALSKIVFDPANKSYHDKLNKITHEFVISETIRRINDFESKGYEFVIFDAPLLFESGFDSKCGIIISVVADRDVRIRRITARDGITVERAESRIASQLSDEYLIERSDFVIYNNGSEQELKARVASIANKILKR
jgi:dephospho-CoA kinase